MNYNSIKEILDSGLKNMTCFRDNVKNTNAVDVLQSVPWFKFNNSIPANIQVSGYSFIGFGSNAENFRINRRSGCSYYVFREEGILWNTIKFLKIRWSGYTLTNYTTTPYLLEYDVILWETGDITLHMVSVPTSYYTGTFDLLGVSYSAPTAINPDVTFYAQNPEGTSFTAKAELPKLYESTQKGLIEASGDLYTVENNILQLLQETEITASVMLQHGFSPDSIQQDDLLSLTAELVDPIVHFWDSESRFARIAITGEMNAVPLPQTVFSPVYDMTHPSIHGVEKVMVSASSDVLFAVSVDHGQTWKMWTGSTWGILSELDTGMTATVINGLKSAQWNLLMNTDNFQVRAMLPATTSYVESFVVDYIN